jgi:hypothetical protein
MMSMGFQSQLLMIKMLHQLIFFGVQDLLLSEPEYELTAA